MLIEVIDGVWCLDNMTDEELREMAHAEARAPKTFANQFSAIEHYKYREWN